MADGFVICRDPEFGIVAGRMVGVEVASDGITPLLYMNEGPWTRQGPWGIEIPDDLAEAISGLLDRLEEVARGGK